MSMSSRTALLIHLASTTPHPPVSGGTIPWERGRPRQQALALGDADVTTPDDLMMFTTKTRRREEKRRAMDHIRLFFCTFAPSCLRGEKSFPPLLLVLVLGLLSFTPVVNGGEAPTPAPAPVRADDLWLMPLLRACTVAARQTPEVVDAQMSRTNAELSTRIAHGQWNPSANISPSYSQSRFESNSVVDGPGIIRSQSGSVSVGLSKPFATGTSVSLSGGTSGSRSDGSGVLSSEFYSSSVSLSLSQELLRGVNRRINRYGLLDAADGEADALDQFDRTLEGRLSDLIGRWLNLAQTEASLAQLKRDVEQARDNLRQYEERLRIGLSRELDVLSLRRGVADQEVQLAKAERLYAAELRQLRLYWPDIELPERARLLTVGTPPPPPPIGFIDSREGRALVRSLAAASRRVDASSNNALDSLSLGAGISKGGSDGSFNGSWTDLDNPNTFSLNVGLSYSHTFGNEANRIGYHQALIAYDQAKLRARISERDWTATGLELRDRFADAQARVLEQQRLVDAQRAELELTNAQVAVGQATTRDLVDAQQRVSEAVLALYQANLDVLRQDLGLRLHENRLLELLP